MKNFKDFLVESNLARVWQHTVERNIGIITAFRSRYPKAENLQRNIKLKEELRKAGYGLIKLEGHYIEGFETPNAQDVKEQGYLVVGAKGDDGGNLKGLLRKLGKKYNQDSILYKEFDKDAVLIGTQDKDEDGNGVWPGFAKIILLGKWIPQKIEQFYSKMRGKTFVFKNVTQESNIMNEWAKKLSILKIK